jgi:hypothetical protein
VNLKWFTLNSKLHFLTCPIYAIKLRTLGIKTMTGDDLSDEIGRHAVARTANAPVGDFQA